MSTGFWHCSSYCESVRRSTLELATGAEFAGFSGAHEALDEDSAREVRIMYQDFVAGAVHVGGHVWVTSLPALTQ